MRSLTISFTRQQNATVIDAEGTAFTIHRAEEYTTSAERDGTVMVFSQYWVRVPLRVFAGEVKFT